MVNQVGHRRRDAGLWDKYDHEKKEDNEKTPLTITKIAISIQMLENQFQRIRRIILV